MIETASHKLVNLTKNNKDLFLEMTTSDIFKIMKENFELCLNQYKVAIIQELYYLTKGAKGTLNLDEYDWNLFKTVYRDEITKAIKSIEHF